MGRHRVIPGDSAGVYDSMGLISPVTVSGTVIFQETCIKSAVGTRARGGVKKGVEDWIKSLIDC